MTKEEALQLQNSIKQLGSSKVADMLIGKTSAPTKPKISRHLKRMTYYRERFALQMKSIIDEMIDEYEKGEHKERFFKYEDYKDTLTKNSLYLKISQSWLYLRNELDPNGKYKAFAELIFIVRRKDGIRIRFQKDITDDSELKAHPVISESNQKKEFNSQIDEFITTAKMGDELSIGALQLDDEEINMIEAQICQLDNFIYKILPNKIWMAKIGE